MLPPVPPDLPTGVATDRGGVGAAPVQMGEKQAGKQEQGGQRNVTRAQLHAELMDFADRFSSSVWTYASEFEKKRRSKGNGTPECGGFSEPRDRAGVSNGG